jgi:hypothetical protein
MLTRFCNRRRPFFRPHFLGDKFIALDYLVELLDAGPSTPYFFVQVKTTTQGYTRSKRLGNRLKIQVSADDMQRLIHYPAPTYIIGIDEQAERGYIVSANDGSPTRLTSLTTDFPLDCTTLERLWYEVQTYWEHRDMRLTHSVFTSHAQE